MKPPVVVTCLVIAVLLAIALLAPLGGPAAGRSPVRDPSLLLLGRTNSPTGNFVRFCLSNSTGAHIACVPEAFEQMAGGTWVSASLIGKGSGVANWVGLQEELKPGESMTFLVPQPTNAGAWRLVFMCQERSPLVDPATDTVRHLTDTNSMKTGLRQYSGRRYHVTSPEMGL